MATSTPWGKSQGAFKLTSGITQYTTASHGGYKVKSTLNNKVPARWRSPSGWYEEDCGWAPLVLTFPEAFHRDLCTEARLIDQAHRMISHWEQWVVAMGWR